MKTLSRCRNNIEADNVVLIDVDTYNFNNVIVLDIPESQTKKQGGSNDKKRPLRTYIYIDDDESSCDHHVGAHLHSERNGENGASSSRRYGPENASPVKLSKGKRTYSGRGFNAHLDSDSTDDEGPDCEFIEDFSGQAREQWEKASLKRKGVVHDDQTGSSSRSFKDAHSVFGVNKSKQKHDQGSDINRTSHEKNVESSTCDARDVDGDKDDLPFGKTPSTSNKEEKEKDDLENDAATWEKVSSKRKSAVHNDYMGSSWSYGDVHSEFGVNKSKQNHAQDSNINGTSHEKKGESFNFDARDVDGVKDDLPLGETPSTSDGEENDNNDIENVANIYDDVPDEIGEENVNNDLKTDASIDDDDVPVEDSIIGEREKFKETEEYKRALEQEMLARQKALQIQAEEARQLRRLQKRKNAECLRLLDMERRQKLRVEEIRESKKKDEENMNLKEQYRQEVRQELMKLEFSCYDMASLLRGLGIQVGNGPVVLPHEVRAAYKRALLSFHPDRASGSDMRQQVEAEEKFKLISRMKEKFSL